MKKGYKPKQFESRGFIESNGKRKTDTSANIYESMLLSEAFMALSDRQKVLYIYCKAQYYGHRKPEKDYKDIDQFKGEDKFYLNWALILQYGLYKESMHSNFYKDMKALSDHGFIEKISSGANQHKKNIYQFCSDWQLWKPDG